MTRVPAVAFVVALLALVNALPGASAQGQPQDDPISPALEAQLQNLSADEMIGVIVTLYTGESVATAFLASSAMFGAAAVYGRRRSNRPKRPP